MQTKYECTDCKRCANFSDGFRVICTHPGLPPEEVIKYLPVGEADALNCEKFEEGRPRYFSYNDFRLAENFSEKNEGGEITYSGILRWVLSQPVK